MKLIKEIIAVFKYNRNYKEIKKNYEIFTECNKVVDLFNTDSVNSIKDSVINFTESFNTLNEKTKNDKAVVLSFFVLLGNEYYSSILLNFIKNYTLLNIINSKDYNDYKVRNEQVIKLVDKVNLSLDIKKNHVENISKNSKNITVNFDKLDLSSIEVLGNLNSLLSVIYKYENDLLNNRIIDLPKDKQDIIINDLQNELFSKNNKTGNLNSLLFSMYYYALGNNEMSKNFYSIIKEDKIINKIIESPIFIDNLFYNKYIGFINDEFKNVVKNDETTNNKKELKM